jgi:hypothetical protein
MLPSTDLQKAPHEAMDPALLGFPHMLPVELALGESKPREICADYDISHAEFVAMCALPTFQKAFKDAQDMLSKEGMSFRMKAKMQSEALLKRSWALIHGAHTPAAVAADLIKATWKVGGFEPKETDRVAGNALQINIHL